MDLFILLPTAVTHFTETMGCCGCDHCSSWMWHRMDQPGRRSQCQTQAMKGVSFAGRKIFAALKQRFGTCALSSALN